VRHFTRVSRLERHSGNYRTTEVKLKNKCYFKISHWGPFRALAFLWGYNSTTAYGLDGPGIEFRWGRDFPYLSRLAPRPNQPPVQWVPGLSWG